MTIDLTILRELIVSYKNEISKRIRRLQVELGCIDLMRGWREQAFPREGQFGTRGDGFYSFHGTGCSVDDGTTSVEFEFGEGGRVDGFDAWRLHLFSQNFPNKYQGVESLLAIESGLKTLIDLGEVVCAKTLPNRSLCYTSDLFQLSHNRPNGGAKVF
jgi:hypothetical protein